MVLLLNLIPFIIFLAIVYSVYRAIKSGENVFKKVAGSVAIGVLAFFVYSQIQPAYIPKGTVPTTLSIPARDFENVELPPIENRLLTAKPEEQRQEDLKKAFDWRNQVEASKGD